MFLITVSVFLWIARSGVDERPVRIIFDTNQKVIRSSVNGIDFQDCGLVSILLLMGSEVFLLTVSVLLRLARSGVDERPFLNIFHMDQK